VTDFLGFEIREFQYLGVWNFAPIYMYLARAIPDSFAFWSFWEMKKVRWFGSGQFSLSTPLVNPNIK